ncbi:MAG: ATP phosphoribosyltransferase regulatory subunit [Alicyclobacillaceae bacterium]|nr:ATP phosphoribosyltransferase regulatory subunit [Alicyclobacillaceae bacterium]
MHKPLIFEKPDGVKDYLPPLARRKRQLEAACQRVFRRWGYQELITPTMEFLETFQNGALRSGEDRVFKMIDRSGRTVVLRPDMTAPIARVVASSLAHHPLPLRLSYTAAIFRQQERVAGRDAEFTQAGVELIGDGSVDADAEVIALAVRALEEAGVATFRLAVGDVSFLQGVFAEHAGEHLGEILRSHLVRQNFVGYEEELNRARLPEKNRDCLAAVPRLRGGPEVLERAREVTSHPVAVRSLERMAELWDIIGLYGVSERVQIDLSLMLDLSYYTGMIFEGYASGIGFPVCAGGRYDELLARFGRRAPATGFMIGVERVLDALEREAPTPPVTMPRVVYPPERRREAIAFAGWLRNGGWDVALECRKAAPDPAEGGRSLFLAGPEPEGDPELVRAFCQWREAQKEERADG